MKFTYINVDGNVAETEDVVHLPENLIKIGNTYFEKKVEEVKETKKSKEVKEVEPATVEEIDKLEEVNSIETKALEFLKEKKVRGCHLLK